MADEGTKDTSTEKLAAALGGGGGSAEGTTEAADSAGDGTKGAPEGKDTGAKEAEKVVEAFLKADGSPFTKADHDALQAALKAARKEARDAAGEAATLKAKTGDRSVEDIEAAAAATAEATWKGRLVGASARAELRAAGLSLPEGRETDAMARAVRLLDVDALKVAEDGSIEGLSDQIEALKVDFPSLFEGPAARRTTSRSVNGADRQTSGSAPKTAAERIAAALTG